MYGEADTIVLALQHLDRIAPLKKAFKDGWTPTFHTLPVRDGRGYSAVFSTPLAVTAGMIADQRPVLARNVHRAEVEVWFRVDGLDVPWSNTNFTVEKSAPTVAAWTSRDARGSPARRSRTASTMATRLAALWP